MVFHSWSKTGVTSVSAVISASVYTILRQRRQKPPAEKTNAVPAQQKARAKHDKGEKFHTYKNV